MANTALLITTFSFTQDAMVEHKSVDVGHFTAVLARLSVGGVALGLLIGAITWFVVARITHDKMAELAVTIAAAYSAFSIAEALPQGYNVSGVLSLVTLGLVLASTEAKANLSRIGFVEQFWHTAEYLANTYVPCATDCIVHNSGYLIPLLPGSFSSCLELSSKKA